MSKNLATYPKFDSRLLPSIPASGRLSLLLVFALAAIAAPPTFSPVGDNHTRWTSASGFAGGHVYSITQTTDGYLWIGTSNGLMRFDGLTFESIRPAASEPLANPSIVGVTTDAEGQLWTSNGLQVFRYLDGQLKSYLPGKSHQPYQDIVVAKAQNGSLLLAAGLEGISSYNRGSSHLLAGPGELPGASTSLAQGADGRLWIGTHTGLFFVETGTRSVHRMEGLQGIKVNALLQVLPGTLLIGTDKGLWRCDGNSISLADGSLRLQGRQILALAKDLDGSVWIGTESGLFKADANRQNSGSGLRSLEKLPTPSPVTALSLDSEGNVWAGGLEGIDRYRRNAFTTYSASGGFPSKNSGPIYVDPKGRTWFAPSTGGLFWFHQHHLEAVNSAGLNGDGVYSIDGGDGEVWVGRKHGGLTQLRLNGEVMESVTYTPRDGLAEEAVYSVYRSPDGTVWAGTLSHGLTRLRHGKLKTLTVKDGLPSNTISTIAGNASGTVFVGTPSGLGVLREERWNNYTAGDGLPPGSINCLLLDSAGILWIGTTKGIALLQSGVIRVPSKIPDLLSEEILGITESDGSLWISTPSHVVRVKRDALAGGRLEESDCREFGEADGLASVEGVKRNRSVVTDDRGQVWFSLNGGISVAQPSILVRQSAPRRIHIERILADDKVIEMQNNIHVPPSRHRLTFHFASINLTNPDQIRYRYRLDDFDTTWSEPVSIREANYTNLPPGNFRFRVMARNADGLWSAQETSVSFYVESAIWQTRWFQLATFVVFGLLIWALYRLRLLQLTRRMHLRFEERLAERTRIGRELHDTLLQNLTGLALQISGMAKTIKEPPGAAEGLLQLKRQAEDCVRETRQSVWDIRSTDAEVQDLPGSLKHSGQQLTAGTKVLFSYSCKGEPRDLTSDVRQHMLRIAREAIGNAVRHSAAPEVRLELSFRPKDVQLTISDNGIGFDVATKRELSGHFGLATMKERARQINASIQISSTVEQGTSIAVQVPGRRGNNHG